MPELSVLLAAYNGEKYLKQAVDSILNQTFGDFELLMADDGSLDGTRKILEEYTSDPRVKLHHNEVNAGKIATINKLYHKSVGKFVTIHDADDYSDSSRFTKQMAVLSQDPSLIMIGCAYRSFVDDDVFSEPSNSNSDFEVIQEKILVTSQFHGPSMIIRKKVIEEALSGEFLRPFFQDYNEDCDLAIRLTEKGLCTNITEELYHYRILPNSLSKTLTPRKKCLYRMLVHFHKQRLKTGQDDLQSGNIEQAERKLKFLQSRAYHDDTQILREQAAFLIYYRLYRAAVGISWKAVWKAPLNWSNWGTLQYCIRKFVTAPR